jgi:pilus assembly protein FimV
LAAAPAEPAVVPATEPATEPALEESDGNTLEFDLDLSKLGARELSAEAPAAAPETTATNPALDFNFDLIKPPATPAAAETLAQDLAETEELELSLPALDAEAAPALDALSASAATPVPPQPLDFDMGALNLDLDTPPAAGAGLPDLAGNTSTGNPEMATKLDLALAYQEIGDLEGARELLDEVLKGGSAEQADKAQALLEKLA